MLLENFLEKFKEETKDSAERVIPQVHDPQLEKYTDMYRLGVTHGLETATSAIRKIFLVDKLAKLQQGIEKTEKLPEGYNG
jgi:hypothetical protein